MSASDPNVITVVSGLPRSGTSMMMSMLVAGGMQPLADGLRTADEDNPRGYFELEAVKRTRQDPGWLKEAGGKVVKIIAQLLFDLPEDHRYRVIFMRRDLDEVLRSQKKMLERRGEPHGGDDAEMKRTFIHHLEEVEEHLRKRPQCEVLFVNYRRAVEDPAPEVERIVRFLGADLDRAAMVAATDQSLYRQRAR